MENTTALTLNFNEHYMSDIQGYDRVEYRLDDQSRALVHMHESTNNKVLGLWDDQRSILFIRRLFSHDTLVVRATPYNESAITVTFPISGVKDAVAELRESCGW